jgi:acyl transferase domain-containing protein/acyl carrier protein
MNDLSVAIIGMAGRFPGASDIDRFWRNLETGVESISFYSDDELRAAGVTDDVLGNHNYVKAAGVLDDIDLFAAEFFGISHAEASLMDPQHRFFLECAFEALENAAYDPTRYDGTIGVFAGMAPSVYFLNMIKGDRDILGDDTSSRLAALFGNDKDYLSTRVSYKLNLKGPSLTVQTACSTSLVAVHLACQSLLAGEADIALAGGVSIVNNRHKRGYICTPGGLHSLDGHCRPFDSCASGTVFSDGVGLVVLRRLSDALHDRDNILAIIRGSAVNNDGGSKAGYTAPAIAGQAKVIADALAAANVPIQSISFIETHGTGTLVGDPIEIAALTRIFEQATSERGSCAIGSVKSNIGHLNTAAGIAGLIKGVLSLQHKIIPPTLHFTYANPEIDFARSPFFINSTLAHWNTTRWPRRAGVSSFGLGGTNAHIVLEEAPPAQSPTLSRSSHIITLSAKTETSLQRAKTHLIDHLHKVTPGSLADIAYTLQVGRGEYHFRQVTVGHTVEEIIAGLTSQSHPLSQHAACKRHNAPIVFMFSNGGTDSISIAKDVYREELVFRQEIDRCAATLSTLLTLDISVPMLLHGPGTEECRPPLLNSILTHTSLFAVEYSLAKQWISWGVQPTAIIGYGCGDFVAACLSGVVTLDDALRLVALRSELAHNVSSRGLVSISCSRDQLFSCLCEDVLLVAEISPTDYIISINIDAITDLELQLIRHGITYARITSSNASFLTSTSETREQFVRAATAVPTHRPGIPYVSAATGEWVTGDSFANATYWAQNAGQPLRFFFGIEKLLRQYSGALLLEVGLGEDLCPVLRKSTLACEATDIVASVPKLSDHTSSYANLLLTLGRLWLSGTSIDWASYYKHEARRRCPLPTYPHERGSFWRERTISNPSHPAKPAYSSDVKLYHPSWTRLSISPLLRENPIGGSFLIFARDDRFSACLVGRLNASGYRAVSVLPGSHYSSEQDFQYRIDPDSADHYARLARALKDLDMMPRYIIHLWGCGDRAVRAQNRCVNGTQSVPVEFQHLLSIARALCKRDAPATLKIVVVTTGVHSVLGEECQRPDRATLVAACLSIPQENPQVKCVAIDVSDQLVESADVSELDPLMDGIIDEATSVDDLTRVLAYRGRSWWRQTFEVAPSNTASPRTSRLIVGGVYLITGGTGGIGFEIAELLASRFGAKLILVGKSKIPPRADWESSATKDCTGHVARKIRQIQRLEALGAEMQIESADVSSLPEMGGVVERAIARFGRIDGVIHGAGVSGAGALIDRSDRDAEVIWNAKVGGLKVLEQIFCEKRLDFLVLFSSVSSFMGGENIGDYAACNVYLDTFAEATPRPNQTFTISINWDIWKDVGMAADVSPPKGSKERYRSYDQFGLTSTEALDAFCRVLTESCTRIVISRRDFNKAVEMSRLFTVSHLRPVSVSDVNGAIGFDRAAPDDHVEPEAEPTAKIEAEIGRMWGDILGLNEVRADDNFFDLGGDSLVALTLIFKIQERFGVSVLLPELLSCPVLGDHVLLVEQRLLDKIENMDEIGDIDPEMVVG